MAKKTYRELREDIGLTQKELSKKLNMGVWSWSRIELYKNYLKATDYVKLVKIHYQATGGKYGLKFYIEDVEHKQ